MGVIGHGYGSEWQMLRYLGRHRRALTAAIAGSRGSTGIDWLDFPFDAKNRFHDAEWKGLDFLPPEHSAVLEHWKHEWPQTGNVMNWDAVGWATTAEGPELILVEAKSHLAEVNSECGAKEIGGLPKIRRFLDQAKQSYGVPIEADWLKPHYQYCNRLAMLAFLSAHGIPAHLVFLYLTGDCVPGAKCPPAASGWQPTLAAMKSRIQLPPAHPLEHVHEVFLPVVAMPSPDGD
ncbi:hypothetical protein [uncultured Paludibaculum sp.]|uniref:hypothetical protein n=1 Tax=uncultured Paludibaculum sp. TaxID=1765020 RepID=UPI002AAB966A|nr:hypothetical protein [uncultured Paludibaculum sp.]